MDTVGKFHSYWEGKTSPLHRKESEAFYRKFAKEMKVLLPDEPPKSVLEIGCGTGAFYRLLGFDQAEYKGVDFSASMLGEFRAAHGDGINLECTDGSSYRDDRTYDLIFSLGVIQNFDPSMLKRFFTNARSMMHPKSTLVCASVPWRRLRLGYLTGEFTSEHAGMGPRRRLRGVATVVKAGLWSDPIGHWYTYDHFAELARANAMAIEFYGAMIYSYRFHAVLTPL